MFQTLGYFLELCVSLYFLSVVTLFLINVCEFMPMTLHEAVDEKIYVWRPKKTDATAPKFVTSEPPFPESLKGLQQSEPEEKLKITDESKSTPSLHEKEKQATPTPEQATAETPEQEPKDENQIEEAAGEEEIEEPIATPEPEAQDDSPDAVATAEPGEETE